MQSAFGKRIPTSLRAIDFHWLQLPQLRFLSGQNLRLSLQKYICRDKTCDCRYKSIFVATKRVIVATKVCLSRQKIVVVAAFANDNRQKLSVLFPLPLKIK